ncbi:amidohydrolase family protein [Anaerovorax odorimutans]|uniref:Amidohydrolase family protein n=1 Tax=Anaerovorax odorimutans TaxID=109327 RepID=A0ABT1RPU9_9FIRM|nr:amidohydrolase family protein [Anaerovorax odorimutans]MCQ4637222.1 amidohydrolase family protein [Anaerovorax odorimutans]
MIILNNAKIYTARKENLWADTLAYDDGKIVYVGNGIGKDNNSINANNCSVFDLRGKTVLPGFIDSHIHPGAVARSSWHIKLPWTENVDEVLGFIKTYAKAHPKEEIPFLYFEYYPTSMFDEKGPTKELLDTAVSDRPCLCQDFGEHLCWLNSKMLELLQVDANTPDPSALEVFVRDREGNPTGWVKEMAWAHFAENMFRSIDWRPPETLTAKSLTPFFDFLGSHGITAMCDGFIEADEQIQSIYEMDRAGELNVYYDGMVRFWSYEDLPEKISKLRRYQKLYSTKHIKINTMKLFLDGTNESGNSASLHPHVNDPDNYGEIMMETEELTKCFVLCNEEKLDLHIHMVGDRAFRVGCDAVAAAQKIAAANGTPWVCQPVFAHCEIVDPEDMPRPAELGITINWSCHWSGGYFGEEAMNYYTEEKWRRMYQFTPFLDSGALVAFSSDVVTFYELNRADPMFGIQVANTRIDPQVPLNPAKYPNSMRPPESAKLSLDVLLKGYTLSSARQSHWETIMGTLEEGKLANLCVLSNNPFEVRPGEIGKISFETVIFEGEVIHGKL